MVEQRRHGRAPLGQPIEFSTKGDELVVRMDGVAKDISLGGMFIETDTPALLGEEIVIHLNLPRATREMTLPATVRWTRRDGMGVQFGLLGAVDTHAITEFVRTSTTSE